MNSDVFTLLKSWILMLNMTSLKKRVGVFLCQIHSFGVRICFEKFFSSMALYDVIMDENTAILLFRELKINMRLTDCVLYPL